MSKPTVFVGSSSEGVEIARAIQYQLSDIAEVEIWNEGVFGLNQGTLESLVQSLDQFDFAIFVLTPDDLNVSRGDTNNAPRDNVLLELGLFMGRIGRGRTFAVYQKDETLRIPSDLAGVSLASFTMPADDGKLVAALGPACFRIRGAIKSQQKTMVVGKLQDEVEKQHSRIDEQQQRLEEQQAIINKLVVFSMSFHIFRHLAEIYHRSRLGGEYLFRKNDAFERDIRFLRDHGYIEMLFVNDLQDGQNLIGTAKLTPVGNFYVELREAFEQSRRM